jgi:penicillin-binding protein 1A
VPHLVIRVARHAGLVALFVVAALLGILSGVFFAYAGDLPQIAALDDYTPSTITRVYAAGGEVIGEFATERRVIINYGDISPKLRQAILSAEDADFDRHGGLSIPRIVMTAINDVLQRRIAGGASTLTQQLARKLFLTPEKSMERKIKEAILAIQIEKRYTKPEILTLYCNKMYFGQGAYGVEAAARLYFNKSAKDVDLDEAALLAGILQLPSRQDPVANPRNALRRRNYVLQRMAEERYITPAEAEEAKQRPIVLRHNLSEQPSIAPYFVEEIRKYLEEKYGAKQLYEKGLSVQTSLDYELQLAANRAIDEGLRRLDKRRGWRRAKRNVLAEHHALDSFTLDRWARPIAVGDIVPAVVVAVGGGTPGAAHAVLPSQRLPPGGARLRVGTYHADLLKDGFAWTRRTSAADLVKPGDLIDVRITKVDEATGTVGCTLEQEPVVEGALLALDNHTGQVRAMVGGFSFARSKFNRAVQAYRQMGSGFKPIVYTAAIDRGFTPATILLDTPVAYPGGPGQPPYMPHDYDGKFEGAITLRRAIEQSRNIPAVRTTEQVTPQLVIDYARRFGFQGQMDPYLSLALGASDATLLEAASAFSAFPNQGMRMRPYSITKIADRDGNLLEENRPEPHEAIRADTAFIMTNLLHGVVQRGTAAAAASLNWPLAGKTGTTNDFGDAWFTGFDPNLTAAVWIGFDDKKPLGPSETGAVAALPIWIEFMKTYIAKRCDARNPPAFQPPPNIVFLPVDRATGAVTGAGSPNAILEAFISGTQPGGSLGPDR